MQYTWTGKLLGWMLLAESVALLLLYALCVAFQWLDEQAFLQAFLVSFLCSLVLLGLLLGHAYHRSASRKRSDHEYIIDRVFIKLADIVRFVPSFVSARNEEEVSVKTAFISVPIAWVVLSVVGALPLFFSGAEPYGSFLDCVFESISGFTTTGATIVPGCKIEELSKGILLWRSTMHLMGGMGFILFVIALVPTFRTPSSVYLLRAESTGVAPNKIHSSVMETAKRLFIIYAAMTILLIGVFWFLGMKPFSAVVHGFSIAGTGGFSNMEHGIDGLVCDFGSPEFFILAKVAAAVFMFLFGVNFNSYVNLWERIKQIKKEKRIKKAKFRNLRVFDEQFRFYFVYVVVAIALLTTSLMQSHTLAEDTIPNAVMSAGFHVTSVISSTGLSSNDDFNLWPAASQMILILLMFTGCCAGSTGGGVKIERIVLLFKAIRFEIRKTLRPHDTNLIVLDGNIVDHKIVVGVMAFFFTYIVVLFISVIAISFRNPEEELMANITSVVSCLSNIGPRFGGESGGDFSSYSNTSKIVLSTCMIAGRLEFFPIFMLFRSWKSKN